MTDATRNITGEVNTSNSLKKSEEKYRNLHMSMMDGKDGTVFPVELRTFLFINDSGETEGMWAIVRDSE